MSRVPEIIQLLKERDTKALRYLYEDFSPALYGTILRIVQTEPIAEEVLQETFVKIWQRSEQYDPERGSLFTWMLQIARNLAIDTTRSKNFKWDQKIQALDFIESNSNTDLQTTTADEAIGMDSLIGRLDEKYRLIIDLVYFQGYTHKEIEEEFNIPLGTVKTRLRAAVLQLRSIFDKGLHPEKPPAPP